MVRAFFIIFALAPLLLHAMPMSELNANVDQFPEPQDQPEMLAGSNILDTDSSDTIKS